MTRIAAGRSLRRIPADAVSAAALLVMLVVLWLPFGFNVGFVGDDWFCYMNSRYGAAWATLGRPLLPLPYLMGYALAPGYFAGFNLMLLALLWVRGWLVYASLRKLETPRSLAFAVAALVVACSGDTGVFYMGAINVYFAWDAYFLAFYLMIAYWRRPRLTTLVLMWLAQILCLGIYEAAIPLIVVSPLALLLLPRGSRRRWRALLLRWYVFPVLNMIRVAVVLLYSPDGLSYQSGLVQEPITMSSIFGGLIQVYQRTLLTGWFTGNVAPVYWPLALLLGILVGALCWWLARRDSLVPSRREVVIAAAGLVIIPLGILLYLPTSLQDVTLRTYFAATIGAALVLGALCLLVGRRSLIFASLIGVLVTFGCAHLLQQHADFLAASEAQQQVVAQVAAQVPALPPNSALLVMDETPDRELGEVFWYAWEFQNPFLVAYDDTTLAVALCYPDDSPDNSVNFCAFGGDSVTARISPEIPPWTRPYSRTVLVRYTADHQAILVTDLAPLAHSAEYQPQALIALGKPPEALRRMFAVSSG